MAQLDILFLLQQVFTCCTSTEGSSVGIQTSFCWLNMPSSSFSSKTNYLFPKHLSSIFCIDFSLNLWFLNVGSQRSTQYFRSCCSTTSYSYLSTSVFLLGQSYLPWAGFCLCRGGSHWQLKVIHGLISCFTSLPASQSFSADESSFYSSYGISPSMHELKLHITEWLLFYSVPQMHLFFLSATLILFYISAIF